MTIQCRKCGKADLEFVSLYTTQNPHVFVLAQCPKCFRVDGVSYEYWYDRELKKQSSVANGEKKQ